MCPGGRVLTWRVSHHFALENGDVDMPRGKLYSWSWNYTDPRWKGNRPIYVCFLFFDNSVLFLFIYFIWTWSSMVANAVLKWVSSRIEHTFCLAVYKIAFGLRWFQDMTWIPFDFNMKMVVDKLVLRSMEDPVFVGSGDILRMLRWRIVPSKLVVLSGS